MMKVKMNILKDKLKDSRSKKVIFISHCILNVNTRYLGGAFRSDSIHEIIDVVLEKEIGIVQMRCPEQKAWGGILKPFMWFGFGLKGTVFYKTRFILYPLFKLFTILVYHKLAKEEVKNIGNYIKSGYQVVGIIGVDGSPSCGVLKILDLMKSFKYYTNQTVNNLERKVFNQELYDTCLADGYGMFISELKKQLSKKKIVIRFYSHNLVTEMNGDLSKLLL